jgi:pSer/pThr/pTyr-binding forkhead associated (FHA) protein
MEEYVGIVCGQCDAFNPMQSDACGHCGHALITASAPSVQGQAPADAASAGGTAAEEESMEQARNYICKECSSPGPGGHKFCGSCGAGVPAEVQDPSPHYFGAMQTPGKARLILIRGDQGVEGLSYLLQGTEHVAGRQDAQILFPDDPWMSPRHANFIYRGDKLVVRDEGAANGIYVRVKQPASLRLGDYFLCGEQVFRIEDAPGDATGPDRDQTYFYSSPRRPSSFNVVQVIAGGVPGMVHCALDNAALIGREDSDLNFPLDVFMSGNHAKLERQGDQFLLTDLQSRNGTFVRIRGEQELVHGDYLFLGKQLLRVEMTA